MPVLVETSAWVHALRENGDPTFKRRVASLLADGQAAWCEMTRVELWTGARGDAERQALRSFDRLVTRLPIDDAVWQLACNIATQARMNGLTVPAADLLIFSCARHHNATIVHADRHFDRLAGLPKI